MSHTPPRSGRTEGAQRPASRSRGPWLVAAVLLVLLVLAGLWIATLLQMNQAGPVALTPAEEQVLNAKLAWLPSGAAGASAAEQRRPTPRAPGREPELDESPIDGALADDGGTSARLEVYAEDPAHRRLQFTEREINAVIARDPALAHRAAVRLSPGQVSTRILVDVPNEWPLLGGRRIPVQVGLQMVTEDQRVRARLIGVSIAGIPVPNAWLGGLKGEDLLATSALGGAGAGIESLTVVDGHLELVLAP